MVKKIGKKVYRIVTHLLVPLYSTLEDSIAFCKLVCIVFSVGVNYLTRGFYTLKTKERNVYATVRVDILYFT